MISSSGNTVKTTANGSTTSFVFPYPFFQPSDLAVYTLDPTGSIISARLILGVDYTVTVSGSSPYYSGGTVVFASAPISTTTITVVRWPAFVQLSRYLTNSAFPTPGLEQSLDYLTLINQYLADALGRCLQITPGDVVQAVLTNLPALTYRKNNALGFDANGNLVTMAVAGGAGIPITGGVGTNTTLNNPTINGGTISTSVAASFGMLQSLQLMTNSFAYNSIATKTGSYGVTLNDGCVIYTGGAGSTFTLPTAATVSGAKGLVLKIKNSGSSTLAVATFGSETIFTTSAVTSITVNIGSSLELVSDGTNWHSIT